VLISSIFFPVSAQEQVLLRYNLKPGMISVHKVTLRGLTTTTIGERKQKIDIDTEIFTSQAVESLLSNGNINVVTSIDSGQSKMNGEITIPENVGTKYKVLMSPEGKIINFSGDQIDQTVKQMQMEFPNEPIKKGHIWTTRNELKQGIEIESSYEFLGIEDFKGHKCAKIKSLVKSIGGGSPLDRTYLGMKANGVIHFSVDKGVIVKNVVTSFMDVKMVSSFGNVEQEINTKLFMTMTMELQDF
jgi:hypothetical protein